MQGMASSSLVAVAFGIGIGCYIAGRARKAKPKDMRRVDKKLVDKDICIVTGGSRGIGAGIVQRLFNEGSDIIIADILEDEANNLIESFCVGEIYNIYS